MRRVLWAIIVVFAGCEARPPAPAKAPAETAATRPATQPTTARTRPAEPPRPVTQPTGVARRIVVQQTHDVRGGADVDVKHDGDVTVLRVTSPGGIGWARLELKEGTWPAKIVVRLYYAESRGFRGLEGFEARVEDGVAVRKLTVGQRKGADGMEADLTGLPPADRTGKLFIRWIDFYR